MVDRFCLLEPMASATRIIVQYGMIMMIEGLSMKSLKIVEMNFLILWSY